MRIADVKAVYPNYRHVAPSWRTHLWQIVVRVESDTGEVGFGYGGGGKAAVGGGQWAHARAAGRAQARTTGTTSSAHGTRCTTSRSRMGARASG